PPLSRSAGSTKYAPPGPDGPAEFTARHINGVEFCIGVSEKRCFFPGKTGIVRKDDRPTSTDDGPDPIAAKRTRKQQEMDARLHLSPGRSVLLQFVKDAALAKGHGGPVSIKD